MNGELDLDALLAQLTATGPTKVAEDGEGSDDAGAADAEKTATDKLAAELTEAGRLMADSFVDSVVEGLAKHASKAPSSAPNAAGVALNSRWLAVAKKLRSGASMSTPGSEGQSRAEDKYKRVAKQAPHGGSGAETGS